ncbi:MAG: anthranilate synthase component I family protein [Bacteroidia bacterium]
MFKKFTQQAAKKEYKINIDGLNETFKQVCVFESNIELHNSSSLNFSKIIALGSTSELVLQDSTPALEQLEDFISKTKGWLFGYFSYDLKNEIEMLSSKNKDKMEFPLLHFFSPKIVITITKEIITIFYNASFLNKNEAELILKNAFLENIEMAAKEALTIKIETKISKESYVNSVNDLKQHIRKGDIYEVNFCQEFFAENVEIEPANLFERLNSLSAAPFAAYCKFNTHYVMCSSPERYLHKRNNTLLSQPIKGTTRRSKNIEEDAQLKSNLLNNTKEQSENLMIVDLVRNDLSRIAETGSVKVDELLGIYSFKQVHQLISTVSCKIKKNITFTEIIKSTFPMGSMTGAPKIKAMQLIDKYESSRRGLYSGAIGYITPERDFDFNVVIRSILYNAKKKYLSFMVGSAITDKSNAEDEYDECLLKAKAMLEVLQ